jgi:hypothetical protein
MMQSIEEQTIQRCIHILKGNFGAGRGQEALDQHNDDIAALETMVRKHPAFQAPGDTLMLRIVVNELGRIGSAGKRSDFGYGQGAYDAIHRVAKRLISPTGEAAVIMDEQVDVLIPSLSEIGDHSQAIYNDLNNVIDPPPLTPPTFKEKVLDRLRSLGYKTYGRFL